MYKVIFITIPSTQVSISYLTQTKRDLVLKPVCVT